MTQATPAHDKIDTLVKSNDVGLLLEFQRLFQLGEATS